MRREGLVDGLRDRGCGECMKGEGDEIERGVMKKSEGVKTSWR